MPGVKKTRAVMLPKKRDAFTAILRFLTSEDIDLLVDEQSILNRWIYCDALLREKKKNEAEIITEICQQFKVSIFTARNDIGYTQQLFAKSRKIVKKYLIDHHLKRMDEDLEKMRTKIFRENYSPDAKEYAALAKMHETYTYTLNSVPEDSDNKVQPPPIFQFILAPGQVINKPMELDDAMKAADAIINMKEEGGVYVAE